MRQRWQRNPYYTRNRIPEAVKVESREGGFRALKKKTPPETAEKIPTFESIIRDFG